VILVLFFVSRNFEFHWYTVLWNRYGGVNCSSSSSSSVVVVVVVVVADVARLDRWESDQNEWTATLPVMQHFQHLYDSHCTSSSADHTDDDCDNVAVKKRKKKRKIDANNKNYIAVGMWTSLSLSFSWLNKTLYFGIGLNARYEYKTLH